MSTTLDVINGSCLTLLGYFDDKYRELKGKLPGKVPPRKREKGTRKNGGSITRKLPRKVPPRNNFKNFASVC